MEKEYYEIEEGSRGQLLETTHKRTVTSVSVSTNLKRMVDKWIN